MHHSKYNRVEEEDDERIRYQGKQKVVSLLRYLETVVIVKTMDEWEEGG